jgi:hypothetical protein
MSATAADPSFLIDGNQTTTLTNGTQFTVTGTPGGLNDGTFTVVGTTYNAGTNQTTVIVAEPVITQMVGGGITYTPNPATPSLGQLWYDVVTN